MKNPFNTFTVSLLILILAAGTPFAFAKKEGDPAGWDKGKKKGWLGNLMPPGLRKKEGSKAEAEAGKQAKEAKAQEKTAKKEAKKKAKEAPAV